MVTTEIKNSLKEALTELKIAGYELNRPNEDVVTMSVCLTARQSMNALMRVFLSSKGIPADKELNLESLLKKCKKADKQFEFVNIKQMACKDLGQSEYENNYCLSTQSVTGCMEIAKQLKMLVLEKLKLTEEELV